MRGSLVITLCCALGASAQTPEVQWRDSLHAYWDRINKEYRDPDHSPLLPEDRAHFTELERYAVDPRFRVMARYKDKAGKPFGMPTTTDRRPQYQAVGVVRFIVLGRKEQLTVYRNIELSQRPEYVNYLFIPFTDLTNGETTYGGGRYLELQGPLEGEVEIDFNRAYNPYCAYGGHYSCPIPPEENHLEVSVEAGVKAFAH